MILSQGDCDDCVVDALFPPHAGAVAEADANSGAYMLLCCVNRDLFLVTGPCTLLCPSLFLPMTFQS